MAYSFHEHPRMNVVIVGASGMIGRAVSAALIQRGHDVVALSRKPFFAAALLPPGIVCLDLNSESDGSLTQFVGESDVVINLAGEPIGGARWSPEVKERLVSSRVDTTRRIVDAMLEASRSGNNSTALVNASAVGYYGDCGDDEVREDHGSGAGFLPELCRKWEDEALHGRVPEA